MLYRSARISAVSPSGMLHWLGISGFTMRQPRVVECMVSWVLGYALDGLRTTQGARLIDSTPPARMSSASPVSIARLAWITASRPEPHNRFTCLLYTSDAADDLTRVALGGRRIIK